MRNVIPILYGTSNIPNEGHLHFTNLRSMTGDITVKLVPDYYDGAAPRHVFKNVMDELSETVVPTKHSRAPVAPNFFLEAKVPSGRADVAQRQALP